MTERVIQADYVNWRTVVGRKCLQLIFEIDISAQGEVLEMLGPPRSDISVPCAIFRLDPKVLEASAQAERSEGGSHKKWAEYTRSQQAAILTRDDTFRRYLDVTDGAAADDWLKKHFRIGSKRELDEEEHAVRWDEFVALYHLHRDRQAGAARHG